MQNLMPKYDDKKYDVTNYFEFLGGCMRLSWDNTRRLAQPTSSTRSLTYASSEKYVKVVELNFDTTLFK